MIQSCRRVMVFDLDDTLYLEADYVRSGFAAAGRWAHETLGIVDLAVACRAQFAVGRRGNIFDAALTEVGIAPTPDLVAGLVEAYRNHRPEISLAPDAAAWLRQVPGDIDLALITDGPEASQANKIAALGLAGLGFRPIVMTAALGADRGKPHPAGFNRVRACFGLPDTCFTYVADNAAKDFLAPRRMGWRTIQVLRPRRLHRSLPPTEAHRADRVIESLDELA